MPPQTEVLKFFWHLPGKLATGGKPSQKEQLDWLLNQGFKAIVSLEPIPDSIVTEIIAAGVNHLLLDTEYGEEFDISLVSPDIWKKFSEFVSKNLREGSPVFVHCSSGINRSARFVIRYLFKK